MPRLPASRLVLLGLATLTAVIAGEPDLRQQARKTYGDCAKAGDLWSQFRLESWGRKQTPAVPFGPALSECEITGEALFAFPAWINRHWDLGSSLVVAAQRRIHILAPDGRVLFPSVNLRLGTDHVGLSSDGKFVSCADNRGGALNLGVVAIPGGTERFTATFEESLGWWSGASVVADDGSAAACEIYWNRELNAPPRSRIGIAVRADAFTEQPRLLENFHRVLAIGPDARWLAAMPNGQNRPTLVVAGQAGPSLFHLATGAGLGACITDDKQPVVKLIQGDGSLSDLNVPMGLGSNDPKVMTLGAWLVVGSGWNGLTRESRDAIDNLIPGGQPQPYTIACWRWADLAANPKAAPVRVLATPLSRADAECAAIYRWNGPVVKLLDFSGKELAERPLVTAPFDVEHVDEQHHRTRIRMRGGEWLITDRDANEIWRGPSAWFDVQDRTWGVAHLGPDATRTCKVVRLDRDPAKRKTIDLELEPGRTNLDLDRLGRRFLATRNGEWIELSPTGKRIRSAPDDRDNPRPAVWRLWGQPSRWYQLDARLVDKQLGEEGQPRAASLCPIDAWRFEGNLITVEPHGRVLAGSTRRPPAGKKPGEMMEIGRQNGADRFSLLGRFDVGVAESGNRILALLATGPVLKPQTKSDQGKDPIGVGWRLDNGNFCRSGQPPLRWDEARTGFRPARLRSPDQGGLLVITPSLIIDLDPGMARTVGKR